MIKNKKYYFSLGKDLLKIKKNNNITNSKLTYDFLENKLIQLEDVICIIIILKS